MDAAHRPFNISIHGAEHDPDTGASPASNSFSMPLRIERRLYTQIVTHLQKSLPVEGCGLIAFDSAGPVKVYPGTNVLRSENRYRMDDREVLRAVDEMERRGWVLGAIYHSHPNSPPIPSATDLREATWPDALMMVVSLMHGVPDMRAYRVSGQSYEDIGIEVYEERMPWLTALRARAPWTVIRRTERHLGAIGHHRMATSGSEIDDGWDTMSGIRMVDDPERRAVIGILGGMGPLATADLYTKIIEITPAATDQEHIPVLIYADPRVPDRTNALLHGGEDPTPWLVSGARTLSEMGADFIVIPCNTAHAFIDNVRPAIDRPILSMIDATADEIQREHPTAAMVGLLATSGTIAAGLYQQALRSRGYDVIVPDDDVQRRCVMAAIAEVKAGRSLSAATSLLVEAGEHLIARGAVVLLEACTEIPIALQQRHMRVPVMDATAALARTAVATALHLDHTARSGDPQWETSTTGWDIVPAPVAGT